MDYYIVAALVGYHYHVIRLNRIYEPQIVPFQ